MFSPKTKKAQFVFLLFFVEEVLFLFVCLFVFLKLEDNCFTMLFWFLPYLFVVLGINRNSSNTFP